MGIQEAVQSNSILLVNGCLDHRVLQYLIVRRLAMDSATAKAPFCGYAGDAEVETAL